MRPQALHLTLVVGPIRLMPKRQRRPHVLELAASESVAPLLGLDAVDMGTVQAQHPEHGTVHPYLSDATEL
jgi:hypothetical protein